MDQPHIMLCPACGNNKLMTWNPSQGHLGGWCCPNCGHKQDFHG